MFVGESAILLRMFNLKDVHYVHIYTRPSSRLKQMSTSTTTLVQQQPLTAPPHQSTFPHTCDKCGADLTHAHPGIAEDARRRISELETQVKILTGKATAAGSFSMFLSNASPTPGHRGTTFLLGCTSELRSPQQQPHVTTITNQPTNPPSLFPRSR